MDVGADFPADTQSTEPVQKCEGRHFDDPAILAEAALVRGAAPGGDERADAQLKDLAGVDVVVVTAVGVEGVRALTGSSPLAADGRYGVDQEPWLPRQPVTPRWNCFSAQGRWRPLHMGLEPAAHRADSSRRGGRGHRSTSTSRVSRLCPGASPWCSAFRPPLTRAPAAVRSGHRPRADTPARWWSRPRCPSDALCTNRWGRCPGETHLGSSQGAEKSSSSAQPGQIRSRLDTFINVGREQA